MDLLEDNIGQSSNLDTNSTKGLLASICESAIGSNKTDNTVENNKLHYIDDNTYRSLLGITETN